MSEPIYDQQSADNYYLATENRELRRERDAWEDTARSLSEDVKFWRDLVQQIGALLGPEAYIADDGNVHKSVVALKVPDLVAAVLAHRDALLREKLGSGA